MQMKTKVKVSGKSKDISIQRDILGLIVAASNKEKSAVDIEKALTYPLAPVSLPLASADGARRKTAKGKLLENLPSLEDREINIETLPTSQKVYILDHVASIRTIVKVPNTFEDLALILLNGIPKMYQIIYIACDTYRRNSIKRSERLLRGYSEKFVYVVQTFVYHQIFKNLYATGKIKSAYLN